jgi:hypothetical protein
MMIDDAISLSPKTAITYPHSRTQFWYQSERTIEATENAQKTNKKLGVCSRLPTSYCAHLKQLPCVPTRTLNFRCQFEAAIGEPQKHVSLPNPDLSVHNFSLPTFFTSNSNHVSLLALNFISTAFVSHQFALFNFTLHSTL